jgi:hypothetical protein
MQNRAPIKPSLGLPASTMSEVGRWCFFLALRCAE